MARQAQEKRPSLKARITRALESGGGKLSYWSLMEAVWPQDEYPRAYRYSANGGPPGVAMVLGRALREMQADGILQASSSSDRMVYLLVP